MAGDGHWGGFVRWAPKLTQAAKVGAKHKPLKYVDWQCVTLGDLASQLSGIAWDGMPAVLASSNFNKSEVPQCKADKACDRKAFFESLNQGAPVYLPGTTPIFSNAAY
ncbi:hypothetical protein BKA65DRAFT_19756 [Rhexocercosporidium sp. MPI-PUGE-AT-0058]|nr:hypothetical protein BKA65DRAFT_19756 [Rhexocercosporidium sp. MPI-PUGE-AT-0058]